MLCERKFESELNFPLSFRINSKQIDGGGPVLWQDPSTGSLALVGIIPHGNSCTNGQPSVNVRVTEYLQWIVANTPGKKIHQF